MRPSRSTRLPAVIALDDKELTTASATLHSTSTYETSLVACEAAAIMR